MIKQSKKGEFLDQRGRRIYLCSHPIALPKEESLKELNTMIKKTGEGKTEDGVPMPSEDGEGVTTECR